MAIKIISKPVKGIIAVMIIAVVFGLLSLLWSSWAGLIALLAGIGGMIAFLGLWIEKEADDEEKKERLSNFVGDKWLTKYKSEIGWWILMFGIFIEVATAIGFAAYDAVETKITADKIKAVDPRNQQISDISATVDFKVKEADPSKATDWNPSVIDKPFMMLCESNMSPNTNVYKFFGVSHLAALCSDKFFRYFDGKTLEYVMNFHIKEYPLDFRQNDGKTVGVALNNVHIIDINVRYLPADAEILGGSVVLNINSSTKIFLIPDQKNLDPMAANMATLNFWQMNRRSNFYTSMPKLHAKSGEVKGLKP